MEFKSGKNAGKTSEEVLLKKPDWARWYTQNYPEAPHSKEFRRLAKVFDEKPFTTKCDGACGKVATRASAYTCSPSLRFWCDDCSPTSQGASPHKLHVVNTLRDVMSHIEWSADGYRAWKRDIVRQLAEAKGLPKRVGKKQALAFFS
jgi:hypothetical protein